jgi:hypothetical protein
MSELLKKVVKWGGVSFVNHKLYILSNVWPHMSTGIRVSGMNTNFSIHFINICGCQMLPVPVLVDTDSYLNPCPTDFFTRGHMNNGYPLSSLLGCRSKFSPINILGWEEFLIHPSRWHARPHPACPEKVGWRHAPTQESFAILISPTFGCWD